MKNKCYVDTNILMEYGDNVFENYEKVFMHVVTLEELDHINHRSENNEKRYKARKGLHAINEYLDSGKLEVILEEPKFELPSVFDKYLNDNRILATAKDLTLADGDIVFLTDDLNLLLKAKNLDIPVEKYNEDNKKSIYKGYTEIILTDEEIMSDEKMALFYNDELPNIKLNINEYLLIKDEDGNTIDKYKWNGEKLVGVPNKSFKSIYFDDFKPKDFYQLCAMDSLIHNDLTVLFGGAGSGKTLISLSYIMQQINFGKIEKAVIVFNPAKLKNNEQLGYYSGNRIEKLMQNSIGGILSSKFGSIMGVETLIAQGKLMIIPTSDIRGIEISKNDVLYVTEAQNIDDYTMRTIIQRAEDGCKVIIEGDILEQRDIYIGLEKSGMYRAIEVFKNEPEFGCIKLENIYRSRLADLAQSI